MCGLGSVPGFSGSTYGVADDDPFGFVTFVLATFAGFPLIYVAVSRPWPIG